MLQNDSSIRIWHNKLTDAPSVEVGPITVDLGQETPAQTRLFQLVMNHPEAVAQGYVVAPVTPEIAAAFETIVHEEVRKLVPKRIAQTVNVQVERGT